MKHNTTRTTSSMGGWEPLPSAVWHDIAEHLPQPWTDGQAAHDLRVYASQVRLGRRSRIPGRPTLRARWGWSDRQVRKLMLNEPAWQDPRFAGRTLTGQSADSERTESRPVVKVAPSEADSQRTASGQRMSTRADIHRSHTTEHKLSDLWSQLEAIRTEANPKARALKLTSGRRRALSARLKEHTAEELVTVWRWWQTSQHDRAVWLRSKCTVDTILRPSNFPGYLDLASMAPTTKTSTDADEVWGLIIDAMGRVGSRRLPTPADIPSMDADTITRAIAALGGPGRWSTLCQTHSRELQFRVRPMFVRSWGSHV